MDTRRNDSVVTPAMVLRRADYGDYDRMVTLLSPEYGKLSAIVRGVRRPRARLTNAAEPFCTGEYQLRVRNGRYSVEQFALAEGYLPIREDYDKLVHGAYWLKLADWAAVEDVPCPELFQLLAEALSALAEGSLPLALTTFAFESHFLEQAGMSPNARECAVCGCAPEGREGFSPAQGGLVCARHRGDAPPIREGARRILLKLPRTAFGRYVLLADRPEWPEAARHLRAFVAYHVDANIKKYPEI